VYRTLDVDSTLPAYVNVAAAAAPRIPACCCGFIAAGMLQSASNLLQSGVRLWDRVHSHDRTARSARDDVGSDGAAAAAAAGAGSSNAAASLIVQEGY